MARIELRGATLKIQSGVIGAGTPESVELKMDSGALTFTETKNWNYNLDRGHLDTVTQGDDSPMSVTLNGVWERLLSTAAEDPTPYEAIKGIGNASTWLPASAAAGEDCPSYNVNIVVENRPPYCEGALNLGERLIFPQFRFDTIDGSLADGTLTFTGQCNALEPIIESFPLEAPDIEGIDP